ncbi:hypothetical protein Golax_009098 [Gossypium laxum]|uniref:Zinc knuckle CX2CX4HX4C domain-containing protein n=1 Tax=Gossypium laxum TaxID=34288 RepID=A0A7J9ADJ6_9ROSI|nr:hypothetical protein [Gossypium laxum]
MAVFINLDRSLVSQVLVNGEIQWVIYEALLTICFSCGKYRHVKEMCLSLAVNPVSESKKVVTIGNSDSRGLKDKGTEKETLGSRFAALTGMGEMIVDEGGTESLRLGISKGLDVGFEAQEGIVQQVETRVGAETSLGNGYAGLTSKQLGKRPMVIGGEANIHKGGLGFGTVTHFNPTFEDTGGMDVTLDGTVLDPGKHTAITFKENSYPNKDNVPGEATFSNRGCYTPNPA